MVFFIKIDLHCHTRKIKNGEAASRNVSIDLFQNKVIDNNVKIIAITNHNSFDLTQFESFDNAVKDDCQLWPGIELDIAGEDRKYHLLLISDPENTSVFNDKVQSLTGESDLEQCSFEIKSVIDLFVDIPLIYIPHFHKTPGISEKDKTLLMSIIPNNSYCFFEPTNLTTAGIFTNHDIPAIFGSDVKEWEKYEQYTLPRLRLHVESFNQFCLLTKRDKHIINTMMSKKQSKKIKVSPHKSTSFSLTFFNEINVIFGQKGTGKSEIMKSIASELTAQGISFEKYFGATKEDDFKSLLKVNDLNRDVTIVNSEPCNLQFQELCNWEDKQPTLLFDYELWITTKGNDGNKKKLKIANSVNLPVQGETEMDKHHSNLVIIDDIYKTLTKIELETYIDSTDLQKLNSLIQLLKNSINNKLLTSFVKVESIKLTNYSIKKLKEFADKKTGSKSKPATTGFSEFVNSRMVLKLNSIKILENIIDKELRTPSKLGSLDDKGDIYIETIHRMLDNSKSKSKTSEFDVGIQKLRELKTLLCTFKSDFFDNRIGEKILEFQNICNECSIKSTTPFLGLSKQIVLHKDNTYIPYDLSNGEKSILMLQSILDKDSDAYLLDEPELGMGNSFIDSSIRPKITDLGKRGKLVIVATHNANIAVRTLPYASIFRVHENGEYLTYHGNPFKNELVNIDDNSDTKFWIEESIHTLEGGKEAFYERRNVYESGNITRDIK